MGANAVTTVPVYVAGEVLTAADLNITNSGIPVFATTTTRDAAFGGTGEKTLAEGQFAYLEDTNTTQYYDGAAWVSVAPARQIAIFNETQASNTNGGTATAGSYVKRVLNTTIQNNITGCSIASSVITLAAGTYALTARAPHFDVTTNSSRLQNTTDATTTQQGSSNFCNNSNMSFTFINAYFTITGTKNFELQTRVGATVATNGYGTATAFGPEIYSFVSIERFA